MNSPLQKQTKKYKEAYKPEEVRVRIRITVDEELASIVKQMKADSCVNKAIRAYAKAFLGWS